MSMLSVLVLVALSLLPVAAAAAGTPVPEPHGHLLGALPHLDDVVHVLLLRDYNTRLVVLSTAILGLAAGLIGCFLLLRKRALMGDALSHATLPGIALAFMAMALSGGTGKWLPGLLGGALFTGLLGVGCVLLVRQWTLLKDDVALGIVLSVFFGLGVALLGFIQSMPQGSAAGLESFIYGKTASMVMNDFLLISVAAAAVVIGCVLLFKEFRLICFDAGFAAAQGWPVNRLDVLMLTLAAAVTVIGLQAVGLVLVLAMLIIPASAARFWTESLSRMTVGAAIIGVLSGWLGASLSALMPRLPAGAVIVVVSSSAFFLSMVFGPARGVLVRAMEHWRLERNVANQHVLRCLYELVEHGRGWGPERVSEVPVELADLTASRSWHPAEVSRLIRSARRRGDVGVSDDRVWLTPGGALEAARVVRNHRLWEAFLLKHADIAASHVDRGADRIEHVLGTGMVRELEQALADEEAAPGLPVSPHAVCPGPAEG